MTHKVAIGAGHGGNGVTPGKRTPDGEFEWSFNDKVVRSAIRHLKAYGFDVLRLDDEDGKADVSLGERTRKANEFGADVLVSVHHNAYRGNWGGHTGTETFIYEGLSDSSEASRLAHIVQERMLGAYKLKDRGVKKANFHMLRESSMPAILTEGGYMDSKIDIKRMRDDNVLENVGEAIADGVAKYFGVDDKAEPAPASKVKSASTSQKAQKGAYKGNSIVDYLNHSGIDASPSNRRKLARKYGVDGYDLSASKNLELLDAMRNGGKSSDDEHDGHSLPNAVYEYDEDEPYPRGSGVRAVQEALASVYYYPNKGAKNNGVDGVYGPNTADAVERFQSMHGLVEDGVYGPKTRAALIKAMN